MITSAIKAAATALKKGAVVAYPTESCYGLGCDPENTTAIQEILRIKNRPGQKGLLIIAASLEQIFPYINVDAIQLDEALATWPGPVTWVIPASSITSPALRGEHNGIAVRVTDHPVAGKLCEAFGGAIVSTSANPAGLAPALTADQVREYFSEPLIVVDGEIGELARPTPIYDLLSGKLIRA